MVWNSNKSCLRYNAFSTGGLLMSLVYLIPLGSPQLMGGINPICGGIGCDKPPQTATCEIVGPLDLSIPLPTGPRAMCCPVWKCTRSNDPGNYFSFHGVNGGGPTIDGSETVEYKTNGQMSRSMSTATGAHNAQALAGGDAFDMAEAMKEINKALLGFGFGR